ncbi:immunity 53 family protein [Pinisolibacter aquiterrae]|uniref:immunity 53 family protein n=1 Tax=Pinisolibacter aquiterrae TaxID=2815579 RepID=UPI001C3E1ED0|nr:immunity 53 family protein [Pinisolibacter aquiterrae]MBV5264024.1 immunity 53 family protein [Pinisolibacter aquiterrae]MCC8233881.1 immunity 53 family protein [Pinisolibacter aquiterrae]
MDVLDWFARWYESQCDGDWEHGFGPSIGTLDNPGWSLEIDLTGTDCDGRTLERITHNYEHETGWWTCWTDGNVFRGAGGPLRLRSLLEAFRDWATNGG